MNTIFDTPYDQKFEEGDVVRSINGVIIENDLKKLSKVIGNTFSNESFTYVVERNGRLLTLNNIIQNPPRITQVLPKSSAISAGLEKGDLILSLNSEKISNFNQIKKFVETSEGEAFTVEYWRKGLIYETELNL